MTHTAAESLATLGAEVGASLDAHWMPFTANRDFKRAPRLLVAAKDMHYTAADGRRSSTAPRGSGA
jgi:beta-alanine--pyruvate transaminase